MTTLGPRQRQVLSALALVAGVWLVTQTLRGNASREVEVRVPLAAFVEPGEPIRAAEVSFVRGGEALRTYARRFVGDAPSTWVVTVSVPEGPMQAHVEVRSDRGVVEADEAVTVTAGEALELRPPRR